MRLSIHLRIAVVLILGPPVHYSLSIAFTLSVVDKLGFDLILGMDFLKEEHAVVDTRHYILTIYDGLMSTPMIKADHHSTAYLVANVTVPPFRKQSFAHSVN